MSRKRVFNKVFFIIVLSVTFSISNVNLQKITNKSYSDRESYGVWRLPFLVIQMIAGEFKGLFSDYLTLEAGAQLGTKVIRKQNGFEVVKKEYNWQNIHRILLASQSLDPVFMQTQQLVQGWLPWEPANMVYETQKYTEVTAKERFWDWQPYRSMAFNSYYFLNDNLKASEYFLKAAQVKNAPPFLGIVGSRLALKGGSTDLAIMIVRSMLADISPDKAGYQDLQDRLVALQGVQIIENAIKEYKTKYDRLPENIRQLMTSGLLKEEPVNPYNVEYCIGSNGEVSFDNPQCKEANIISNR